MVLLLLLFAVIVVTFLLLVVFLLVPSDHQRKNTKTLLSQTELRILYFHLSKLYVEMESQHLLSKRSPRVSVGGHKAATTFDPKAVFYFARNQAELFQELKSLNKETVTETKRQFDTKQHFLGVLGCFKASFCTTIFFEKDDQIFPPKKLELKTLGQLF